MTTKTTTATINTLVKLLIGSGWNRDENMVQGAVDKTERPISMSANAFELGLTDPSKVIDMYHWYWDRGLELSTIDAENKLEQAQLDIPKLLPQYFAEKTVSGWVDKGQKARKSMDKRKSLEERYPWLKNYRNEDGVIEECMDYEVTEFKHCVSRYREANDKLRILKYHTDDIRDYEETIEDKLQSANADIKAATRSLFGLYDVKSKDVELSDNDKPKRTSEYNNIHWNQVSRQGDALETTIKAMRKAGTLTLALMPMVMDELSEQYSKKLISRYSYARCSYLIAKWLGWSEDMERFEALGIGSTPKEIKRERDFSSSYDDRFFGQATNYNMEDVIDLRRAQPHLTLDEAIFSVQDPQSSRESQNCLDISHLDALQELYQEEV